MVDNKAFYTFCQWFITVLNANVWVCSIFLKLRKRKDNLILAYSASDPNCLHQHITALNLILLLIDLCLPKRNFLIYIEHIFSFGMNVTLVSWMCMGFMVIFHLEITSGHREIKQSVCSEEH